MTRTGKGKVVEKGNTDNKSQNKQKELTMVSATN